MARTRLERVDLADPGVAAFRISGKLGFHENKKIQNLIEECLKRDFERVVFDFSELSSLGGGVARILREFAGEFEAKGGSVAFVVTSDVVLQFLQDDAMQLEIRETMEEAISGSRPVKTKAKKASSDKKKEDRAEEGAKEEISRSGEEEKKDHTAKSHEGDNKAPVREKDDSGVILMSYDGGGEQGGSDEDVPATEEPATPGEAEPGGAGNESQYRSGDTEGTGEPRKNEEPAPDEENPEIPGGEVESAGASSKSDSILSEIFDGEKKEGRLPDWIDRPTSPFNESKNFPSDTGSKEELNKQLKRKVLELKTLFSISTDFNSIRERKKLIDIFLLTSIAQGGVEAAAFYEKDGSVFKPAFSKGLNTDTFEKSIISKEIEDSIDYNNAVIPLDGFEMKEDEKQALRSEGLEYICAFRQKDELTGLVLLGKRIAGRGMKEGDFEFLKILVNVAQGAYENAVMFEREHDRTLGIVKTLISLIEENTLLKGSSEIVSRYVGMVAKNIDYTEEHFKDLIYGTVLRDMGMIKVSDLILRSPRELTKEEWEIIKRHPDDGAEMLRRMRFNDHVVGVVKAHHERFNGEGYPLGLRGKEIPIGARIISIVESYAAMINERPNRPALSDKEALKTLKENYGMRYDRELVMQFAKIMEKEFAKSVKPQEPVAQ
jgi:HD-GYP domain-containing protein (c-di-GMP phosphodiesterase class II)/anti-anti-sigma regulatory factor